MFWFEKNNSWIDDKFWTLQAILNKTKRKKTQQTKNTKHYPKKSNPSTQESKQIKIIQKTKPNWNNLKQKPAFKHQKSRLRFVVCFFQVAVKIDAIPNLIIIIVGSKPRKNGGQIFGVPELAEFWGPYLLGGSSQIPISK